MSTGNVRSVPLKDGQPVQVARAAGARAFGASLPFRAAGLCAMSIGGGLWLVGSRFTVLGAPFVVAALASQFGLPLALTLPSGWALVQLTVTLGLLFSLVEFGCRPRKRFFASSLLAGLILFLLWLLLNGADVASTYFGVVNPVPDAWRVTTWVASSRASYLWTAFLTWCPELLFLLGTRWLVKGRF